MSVRVAQVEVWEYAVQVAFIKKAASDETQRHQEETLRTTNPAKSITVSVMTMKRTC